MALYHKWGVKTGFIFALQFFMLISDGLGGVIFWEGNKNSSTLDLKDQNSRSNLKLEQVDLFVLTSNLTVFNIIFEMK